MIKFLLAIFFLFIQMPSFAVITDFLADGIHNSKAPAANLKYNYTDTTRIPVYLNITEKISTRDKSIYEGMPCKFKAAQTVSYKGRVIIKQGDIIDGKLKYIIRSGMNGIPYSMTLSEFNIPDISNNKLQDVYCKQGWDRGYIVFPLKWALTFLPPTGSLTNFIKGGHASIKPKDKITLYYYPNWEQ